METMIDFIAIARESGDESQQKAAKNMTTRKGISSAMALATNAWNEKPRWDD